ncbi:hypothetical protein ON010_g18207 [Phytophthora cinnamomi]|nr:hypothetical protein ON010_g18207 [Phytophthora cinnamomi]
MKVGLTAAPHCNAKLGSTRGDELAVVALVVAELGLLVVGRHLDGVAHDPQRRTDNVQRSDLRVVAAVCDAEQHGEQREEDPEALDVPGRQVAQRVHDDVGEALVAAALADAPVEEGAEPHAPEPHEGREQQVAPRRRVAHAVGEHGDRRVGRGACEVEVPLGLLGDAVERRKPLDAHAHAGEELRAQVAVTTTRDSRAAGIPRGGLGSGVGQPQTLSRLAATDTDYAAALLVEQTSPIYVLYASDDRAPLLLLFTGFNVWSRAPNPRSQHRAADACAAPSALEI